MSFANYRRQQGLRPVPGQHKLFRDQNGQLVVVRTHSQRSDFRGEDFGGAEMGYYDGEMGYYDGDELGGVPGRRGEGDLTSFPVWNPGYMGEEMGAEAFQPGYFDGEMGEMGAMMPRGPGQFSRARLMRGRAPSGFLAPHARAAFLEQQRRLAQAENEGGHVNRVGSVPTGWGKTVVGGTVTLGGAGNTTLSVRLQHDFLAEDITFDGSLAGTLINSIFFGDRQVFAQPGGTPIAAFASTGFIRGYLNGQRIMAGLDIQINATLTGAGSLFATITGSKPYAVALGS